MINKPNPEDLDPTDMTPAGLTSPEKIKRTNKAMKAHQEAATVLCAYLLKVLLDGNGNLRDGLRQFGLNPDYVEMCVKQKAIYDKTQDEFLRAVSDNPPRS